MVHIISKSTAQISNIFAQRDISTRSSTIPLFTTGFNQPHKNNMKRYTKNDDSLSTVKINVNFYLEALYVLTYIHIYWYNQRTCMSQAECPESQVRCSVRNAAQAELNHVYSLENEYFTGNKLLQHTISRVVVTAAAIDIHKKNDEA